MMAKHIGAYQSDDIYLETLIKMGVAWKTHHANDFLNSLTPRIRYQLGLVDQDDYHDKEACKQTRLQDFPGVQHEDMYGGRMDTIIEQSTKFWWRYDVNASITKFKKDFKEVVDFYKNDITSLRDQGMYVKFLCVIFQEEKPTPTSVATYAEAFCLMLCFNDYFGGVDAYFEDSTTIMEKISCVDRLFRLALATFICSLQNYGYGETWTDHAALALDAFRTSHYCETIYPIGHYLLDKITIGRVDRNRHGEEEGTNPPDNEPQGGTNPTDDDQRVVDGANNEGKSDSLSYRSATIFNGQCLKVNDKR